MTLGKGWSDNRRGGVIVGGVACTQIMQKSIQTYHIDDQPL